MIKFTKEEISLAKQVAEKYRKVVEEGDYLSFIDKAWLVYHTTGPWISVISRGAKHAISTNLDDKNEWFPLWTIFNCLEWLHGRGFTIVQACEHPMSNEWIIEINPYHSNAIKIMGHENIDVRGDTLLVACLKVVIEVLKNEKL